MKDEILAKYIVGEATEAEKETVLAWEKMDSLNRQRLAQLTSLWEKSGNIEALHTFHTDKAWEKVQQKLANPQKTPALFLSKYFIPLSAAAAILVVAFLYFFSAENAHLQMVKAADTMIHVALQDGSQVSLKNGSFSYPEKFGSRKRKVKLEGTAFFEIKRNEKIPFEIEAGESNITVLGTSFEIESHPDYVRVKVRDGKVKFHSPSGDLILTKGQQGKYVTSSGTLSQTDLVEPNDFAYATQRLVFNNSTLNDVIKEMEKMYRKRIMLSNPALGTCRLTTVFDHESLNNALDIIAFTLNLQVDKNQEEIVLNGKGCQ